MSGQGRAEHSSRMMSRVLGWEGGSLGLETEEKGKGDDEI